ncbi:prepilin-type N-terminal cleavage/methylation domain-containing protein [bacterium]|nr:prepilin-type N-terminal cleavage/methylation domain-containing protein [bacterium]
MSHQEYLGRSSDLSARRVVTKRNIAGFTLVELLVVIALSAF